MTRDDTEAMPPIFLLSPRHREPLEGLAVRAGWSPRSAAPSVAVDEAFLGSRASVAVLDARDALAPALEASGMLGGMIAANGGAMLAIIDEADRSAVAEFYDCGATHFLIGPRDCDEIVHAMLFAARHAARASGTERRLARNGWSHEGGAGEVRRWLQRRIDGAKASSVVFVALSRLDLVNEAYGRPAVDSLIRTVAGRIGAVAEATFGADRIVARIGGTEFVLGSGARGERLAAAAAAIGEALAQPFVIGDAPVMLGTRLGVAEHQAGDDAATLLRRASEALAGAKASDGAMLRIAEADDVAPLDALAVDLHRAIERAEIEVLFQPQVEIASGRIVGVEALARWDHPAYGPLGAEPLFAAAERADLGIALSDHIQQLTLARAVRWPHALEGLRLSINLTAADIARADFSALFLARVDASGFPRGRLTVEVTETGMIDDLAAASAFLARLRGAGCRVAIDDFGTGYSSLAYLKALPLDYLKIDRAMVADLDGSVRDRVVVRGVIEMARSLGLAVIAEGVESEAQLALLREEGCGFYQGFLRAGAIDEAALVAMVEAER